MPIRDPLTEDPAMAAATLARRKKGTIASSLGDARVASGVATSLAAMPPRSTAPPIRPPAPMPTLAKKPPAPQKPDGTRTPPIYNGRRG